MPGPLVGSAKDPSTGSTYCSGTTLEGTWGTDSNSTILQQSTQYPNIGVAGDFNYVTDTTKLGFSPGITPAEGWRQWFAQAFAIVANQDVKATSNFPWLDQAVLNGYLGCIAGPGGTGNSSVTLQKGWMYYVYRQQAVSLPTACKSGLPTMPVPFSPIY